MLAVPRKTRVPRAFSLDIALSLADTGSGIRRRQVVEDHAGNVAVLPKIQYNTY